MKKVLLLVAAALMVASVAIATPDHISVYTDNTGASCNLAAGFSATATVLYQGFTPGGSTGARFKVVPPAGGSVIFSFQTTYVTIGTITNDLSIAYGGCVEGTFPIGTLLAQWAPGNGGAVVAADGFPGILMTDCQFGEYPATGGTFCVASPSECFCTPPVANEPSTWGKVKSLYR